MQSLEKVAKRIKHFLKDEIHMSRQQQPVQQEGAKNHQRKLHRTLKTLLIIYIHPFDIIHRCISDYLNEESSGGLFWVSGMILEACNDHYIYLKLMKWREDKRKLITVLIRNLLGFGHISQGYNSFFYNQNWKWQTTRLSFINVDVENPILPIQLTRLIKN